MRKSTAHAVLKEVAGYARTEAATAYAGTEEEAANGC